MRDEPEASGRTGSSSTAERDPGSHQEKQGARLKKRSSFYHFACGQKSGQVEMQTPFN